MKIFERFCSLFFTENGKAFLDSFCAVAFDGEAYILHSGADCGLVGSFGDSEFGETVFGGGRDAAGSCKSLYGVVDSAFAHRAVHTFNFHYYFYHFVTSGDHI